ncbi:MAG TPA: 4-hydroxy-tetrahydrodipicolinate synthase [Magnetospirillaceae bacterium]|nr:4-hydroxy-tetrahydrodipicolinate synthase [Magnetospirillaceae bacterium]
MDYGRLIVALATPFRPDLEVDYGKTAELARRLAAAGATAFVSAGTTGESPTLSREERIALIKTLKDSVSVPVIANAGTNDTRASIRNARDAEEAGADGILLVVPYYNKPDQGMLYDHFRAVAESVRIPSMLYNVPGRTAVSVRPETVVKLSRDVPTINYVKEASGDLDALAQIVRDAAPGFRAYTGDDSMTLPSLAVGAYGVVSVAGHLVGSRMKELIEAYTAGYVSKAAKLHGELLALSKALFLQPNPVPLKAALRLCGFDAGSLRPPLKDASPEVVQALSKALADLGLLG